MMAIIVSTLKASILQVSTKKEQAIYIGDLFFFIRMNKKQRDKVITYQ